MNSQWRPSNTGDVECFTSTGPITYDNFCVNGSQTCSVTMTKRGGVAKTQYDVPIQVYGQQAIVFGCCIRCIGADCCILQVDFYDANNRMIDSCREDITSKISADFTNQMGRFMCPCNAVTCKLSIQFTDRITACTYCSPYAYFC